MEKPSKQSVKLSLQETLEDAANKLSYDGLSAKSIVVITLYGDTQLKILSCAESDFEVLGIIDFAHNIVKSELDNNRKPKRTIL